MRGAVQATTDTAGDEAKVNREFLDASLAGLKQRTSWWAAQGPSERAALLEAVIAATAAASPEWLDAACRAKGLDPTSSAAGEELFSGIGTLVRMARTLVGSLRDLAARRQPQFPGPVSEVSEGRLAVGVFPGNAVDRILYRGIQAEVWFEPRVTRTEIEQDQAAAYRDPQSQSGVSLVLGAGNVASLGPRDVLSKLFVDGRVVILKANPVNDYLVEHWRRAMKPLIEAGVLVITTGGAAVGSYLCQHEAIDDVHITGSDKTFDAIVFGVGAEGAENKAQNKPQIAKPVTGELGSVSPVIIVPGDWKKSEVQYQAQHVATMITNNAGFNCLTPRVIITWEHWPQREAFLQELAMVLRTIPARKAYYPGASERYASFKADHPAMLELGGGPDGTLPWALIRDLDASQSGDICFNVEAFCSLTSEVPLEASDAATFVDAAVDFANDVVWGSLSATILAHPHSLNDAAIGPAVDRAVANLRYGSIGVNLWHAMSFALGVTTWGAYPGHAMNDIQSGNGVVGNAFMFDHVQKSVVRGPFIALPKPAWFVSSKNSLAVMRRLLDFEAAPSLRKLPALVLSALRS